MKVSLCNAILDMTVEEKKDRNGQRFFLSGLFIFSIAQFMPHAKNALVLLCVITVIAVHFSASSVTDDVYVN